MLEKLMKKRVFTPRKPIWVLKIAIKTIFSSNRNPKPKSLISMLFLKQKMEQNIRFQLRKCWKIDEKTCFYTKEADLSFKNCYRNHFFFQPKSQAKILNFDAFLEQNMKQNVRFQLQKDEKSWWRNVFLHQGSRFEFWKLL